MIVPDIAGYITGWRSWRRSKDGLSLRSWSNETPWPIDKPLESWCASVWCTHDGKAYLTPQGTPWRSGETCGIYALKKLAHVPWAPVVGRVALWGNVAVHKGGYRASYGYPLSLSDKALAERYHVAYEPTPIWVRFRIHEELSVIVFVIATLLFVLHGVWLRMTPLGTISHGFITGFVWTSILCHVMMLTRNVQTRQVGSCVSNLGAISGLIVLLLGLL